MQYIMLIVIMLLINAFVDIDSVKVKGIVGPNHGNFNYNWWGSNDGPQDSYFSDSSYKPSTFLKVNFTIVENNGEYITNMFFVKSGTPSMDSCTNPCIDLVFVFFLVSVSNFLCSVTICNCSKVCSPIIALAIS